MRKYIAILFIGLAIVGLGYTLCAQQPKQIIEVQVDELSCPDGYTPTTYYGFNAEYTIGMCAKEDKEYSKQDFDPITHIQVVCYAPADNSATDMYVAVDADNTMRCHTGTEMGYIK